jgi:hypothetical protein
MLGSSNGMELRRERLEIRILSKLTFGLHELSLTLSLKMDFSRTKWILLSDKVIFVDSFYMMK